MTRHRALHLTRVREASQQQQQAASGNDLPNSFSRNSRTGRTKPARESLPCVQPKGASLPADVSSSSRA